MASMPTSPSRVLVVLVVAATAAMAGCGSGSRKEADRALSTPSTVADGAGAPTAATPGCRQVPAAIVVPARLPSDLPLPPGAYAVDDQSTPATAVVTFVIPMGLRDFVRFATTVYPAGGWRLGHGDSEAHEAEQTFTKGGHSGGWRVRDPYCDHTKSELYLTLRTPSSG